MSVKTNRMVLSVVVCIFAAVLAFGCGGDTAKIADPSIVATDGKYFVYGEVIDGATLKPVSGATVKLFTGNIEQSAVTKEAEAEVEAGTEESEEVVDPNMAVSSDSGDFLIANVAGGDHRLRIEAAGYAVYEEWMSINQSADNVYYRAAGYKGEIKLGYSCDVDTYVTFKGSPVSGAAVYADAFSSPEISAVTDETGKATLAGLSQVANYSIIAPAFDSNADGLYDYTTGMNSGYSCVNSDKAVAIDLDEAGRNDSINIIGGSYDKYKNAILAGTAWSVKSAEPMVLVFNYPVSIVAGDFGLSYVRNLALSTDAQFNKEIMVGVTAALSGGGTILTLTPSEPLFPNETYDALGTATAVINGKVQYFTNFGYSWYVIGGGLASGSITADNYNGTTGQALNDKIVYIEFPEYVDGNVLVKSYVKNGTSTILNQTVNLNSGQLITDESSPAWAGDDGCTGGVCGGDHVSYRVALPLPTLSDDQASSENSVTVFVNATNAEGVSIAEEVTLKIE